MADAPGSEPGVRKDVWVRLPLLAPAMYNGVMKLTTLFAFAAAVGLMAVPAHASPTKGTMVAFPVIQHGTAVMYSDLEFRGGEVTDVYVKGDGGNLDCLVMSDTGAIVARDEGPANGCKIQVKPKKTGKYTVLVTNVDTKDASKALVAIQ